VLNERVRSERRLEKAGRLDEGDIEADIGRGFGSRNRLWRGFAAASRTAVKTCSTSARDSKTDSPVDPTATYPVNGKRL
jgi:hypothetical protein